jgi:hypothetical protein
MDKQVSYLGLPSVEHSPQNRPFHPVNFTEQCLYRNGLLAECILHGQLQGKLEF